MISGILHVLKICCRWQDAPSAYGPHTTIYIRYNRWSQRGIWQSLFAKIAAAGPVPDELMLDASDVKAHRSAAGGKGAWSQAIGRSRGGFTSKIHGLADGRGGPVALALTPGNVADIRMALPLLRAIVPPKRLIERLFGHLKTWRRVATRYDRLACNSLAAVALAACVLAWT